MMVSAVLLTAAIQEDALSPQTMIDAATTTNAPLTDVPQPVAPTLLLFVTTAMHALLINATQDLENASTPHFHARILIFAPSKLVMQRRESSTPQRIAMMVSHVLWILAILTVDASALQTMLFVTTKILALLIPVFLERDV
jgi:hypothetical protein